MHYLESRARILQWIREYFYANGFLETDTPSFVLSPGMEPHIRPIEVKNPDGKKVFLPTSPEFAMKKILGTMAFSKIFQICKAYRLEPLSSTHNPEFAMIEWYRAQSGYEQIMSDVESLFCFVAEKLHGSLSFDAGIYGHQNLKKPWPRYSIEGCFEKFLGRKLSTLWTAAELKDFCIQKGFASSGFSGSWDDLFFLAMMNGVEPELKKLGCPVIIYDYPESQAALSNLYTDSSGKKWGKRFEVYAGGLELGNAFDELADSKIQRVRFEKDMRLRTETYGDAFPPSPMDEEFLAVLDNLPPSGGIAMGVDRMVMYFTGAPEIADVLWQKSWW